MTTPHDALIVRLECKLGDAEQVRAKLGRYTNAASVCLARVGVAAGDASAVQRGQLARLPRRVIRIGSARSMAAEFDPATRPITAALQRYNLDDSTDPEDPPP